MKRLILLIIFIIYGFTLLGQTGQGWRYTPQLQTDITTVNDYLRINLGVVRLNNPLEAGQVIQSRWVDGQLVFQNQAADFDRFILQKASPTVFGGVKIDGVTITMNPDSVISANIPEQQPGVDTIFRTLHPTLPIESLLYRKDNSTYGITSMQRPNGLFTGGVVTWVDSLHFSVSPAGYYVNGQIYTTSQTALELSPSDATYARIDLIVVDTLSQVEILQGIPAENPQKPIANPASQIELTQVLVMANAQIPGLPQQIQDEIIYDETGEWTGSSQGVLVSFSDNIQITPYHGLVCTSVGVIGMEDRVIYTASTPKTVSDFETLSFAMRLKAVPTTRHSLYVEFYLAGTKVSSSVLVPFNRSETTLWQPISLALAQFTLTTSTFDAVHFRWVKTGTGADFTGFYLDYVKLQAGLTQPVAQGQVELVGDVTGRGTSSIVTTVANDSHTHSVSTLPNLLGSIDGVVNDGGNIDLVPGGILTITGDDALNRITISAQADTTNIPGLNEYVLNRTGQGGGDTVTASNGIENYYNDIQLGGPLTRTETVIGSNDFGYVNDVSLKIYRDQYERSINNISTASLTDDTNGAKAEQIIRTQNGTNSAYASSALHTNLIDTSGFEGLSEINAYGDIDNNTFGGARTRIRVSAGSQNSTGLSMNAYKTTSDLSLTKVKGSDILQLDFPTTFTGVAIRYMPVSVNGQYADASGNITVATTSGPNLSVQALNGTTVAWDVTSGVNATLTLSGNTVINLSNLTAGTSGNLTVINPASTYTLTFAGYTNKISPSVYSATNVVKTSGASKTDCYSWYYDGTRLMWNGTLDYN